MTRVLRPSGGLINGFPFYVLTPPSSSSENKTSFYFNWNKSISVVVKTYTGSAFNKSKMEDIQIWIFTS